MINFISSRAPTLEQIKKVDTKTWIKIHQIGLSALQLYSWWTAPTAGYEAPLVDLILNSTSFILDETSKSEIRGSTLIAIAFRIDYLRMRFGNEPSIAFYDLLSFIHHLVSARKLSATFLDS